MNGRSDHMKIMQTKDGKRSGADTAMSRIRNGLQFAAGNNVTHVGTEKGTVIVRPFKIRKPVSYLVYRRNASLGSALHRAIE